MFLAYLTTVLISILSEISTVYAYRVFDVNGVETILALENETVKIQCRTDMPMTYCGFIHPTGKRYSFSGADLNDGHCMVSLQTSFEDSGEWRCHIGQSSVGVEIMQIIIVRVIENEVAAVEQNIFAVHGKPVTLACTSTRGLTPLSYCRFEPPNGQPFSIDADVTPENPILNKYYFPSNKSLDRGDCAVTITKVKYEDVGMWTCGAGLDDGKEHIDVIQIDVEGLYTMSTASATGITFGAIGIFVFLAVLGFIAWKKRRFLGSTPNEPEVIEVQELAQRERTPSPKVERSIPSITVESPSPSTSPLVSSK